MSERPNGTTGMTEVSVRQPPPRAVPSARSLRKQLAGLKKQRRAIRKAGKAEVAAVNFGRRLNQHNAAEARAARKEIRARMRHKAAVHQQMRAYHKHQLKINRYRAAHNRKRIVELKKAKRAASPKGQRRAHAQSRNLARKSVNLLWLWKLAKKLLAKKKAASFRNHGFTASGKGGYTGRAGFHKR